MKLSYLKATLAVMCFFAFYSCSKSVMTTPADGSIGVFYSNPNGTFEPITPLSIYIDGKLITTTDFSNTTSDCSNNTVNLLIPSIAAGSHTFAFVTPDSHYIDGNVSVVGGSCTYTLLTPDNFNNPKTNYGTNKGSLSFTRVSLVEPFSTTDVYVDNAYIGSITSLDFEPVFCGVNDGAQNVSVALSPGTHTFKAVDSYDNLQWSGSAVVSSNSCTPESLN